jgi:hypothetical protein
LNFLYKSKEYLGGFENHFYVSSSSYSEGSSYFYYGVDFENGKIMVAPIIEQNYVRLVRNVFPK